MHAEGEPTQKGEIALHTLEGAARGAYAMTLLSASKKAVAWFKGEQDYFTALADLLSEMQTGTVTAGCVSCCLAAARVLSQVYSLDFVNTCVTRANLTVPAAFYLTSSIRKVCRWLVGWDSITGREAAASVARDGVVTAVACVAATGVGSALAPLLPVGSTVWWTPLLVVGGCSMAAHLSASAVHSLIDALGGVCLVQDECHCLPQDA